MQSVLLDNDVVLKISRYALVDEFLDECVVPGSTYVLPTLKYVFRLNSDEQARQRLGGEEPLRMMHELLKVVDEINQKPDSDILAYFQDVDEIDAGEAILFAIAMAWDQSLTITGDKRALVALSSLSTQIGLVESLSGRLKCIEQTIAEMMLGSHADEVVRKIQGKNWDTALRICFNSGDHRSALDCLLSYYNDVNDKCSGMLAPFPAY